ncbi:hypothetical protein CAEBREN_03714 [Caenorhabditis brenneri]|uniref:Uncharacterized protein n=1 Tax=Caenorhabditis brenneri TaxID=135651 RepID=G0M8S7_CAEBE|nr:hypothetical protein CAEBREN_03714 [Caenorhabditis brenneri]
MDNLWVWQYLPKAFCFLTFLVNPIFVYLIFSEKTVKFGNYRFLLLYFATFNLIYSLVTVIIPMDIHSYRYCFYLISNGGWFVELSDLNTHILAARCSIVVCSYAILLSHFIYRFLVVHNSSLTRENFHFYMTGSLFINFLYYGSWHLVNLVTFSDNNQKLQVCYFLGSANPEMRQYVRKEIREIYGADAMDFNMIGALYQEGSDSTVIRSWLAVSFWISVSTLSIITFFVLARMIVYKLNKLTANISRKTSNFQVELLRALVVQTVIPIFISFSPCVLCWVTPIFGVQLPRGLNYVEVSALGVFAFVDPIAITLCIPVFRKRIFCRSSRKQKNST